MTRAGYARFAGLVIAVGAIAAAAAAQTIDVGRPRTLVVGTPGGSRALRVDVGRTGACRDPLPIGSLRVLWQAPVGALLEDPPVVDASGNAYVVGTRGEVVAVGRDGAERWRLSTGAVQPGPAALLSDDTLVFADALGEAIAVRNGAVRWRVHFGRGDVSHPAPLPLDDGGVIVATAHDLAALDIEGGQRARVTLPEVIAGPLLAAPVPPSGVGGNGTAGAMGMRVIATGSSGSVWAWTPGMPEALRAGSFGAPPEGGAVLVDAHTLIAVTSGGSHLTALDLATGASTARGQTGAGLWLGPPATHAGNVYLTLLSPTAELAVGLDPTGNELQRARLSSHAIPVMTDGGAAPLVALPHAAPLVDTGGSLAAATTDGTLVTIAASSKAAAAGTVELLPGVCTALRVPSNDAGRITGLAPIGPGVLGVACHAGALVAVGGVGGAGAGGAGEPGGARPGETGRGTL